ncbi:MAG TPA: D-xylose ABC transporter ATP-binding protein [Bacteroidetes bacterium]|nr:D-xylose ABC transporter ATP-binding protein [Bacteroidota bacterium]
MSEIIQLYNISKRFGGTVALDGVSFAVEQGNIHAVVGENGAGKSTLMRILSGVLQKDTGTVSLSGLEKEFTSPLDAQREGISTVYQEPYLVPHMTVAENVFLGHEKTKGFGIVDYKHLNARTEEILATLSLKIAPTELLAHLSPAEVQLVQVARAIAFSTKILILDEPTASITEHETRILFRLLKDLNTSGLTVLYVSHRLREIFELCHKATVLRDGKHIGTVDVAATTESEIISMMVGRDLKSSADVPRSRFQADVRLEVRRLTVTQAAVHVSDVSFKVYRGEIVALAGLVGSGRSEVAKALFGLNGIAAGDIFIDGVKVEIRNPNDAIRHNIAFVPEDRKGEGLISTASIKHNISLTGLRLISKLGFVRGSTELALANRSSQQLSIKTSSVDAEVSTLSGGNQQKVVLAKWLWLKPSILILDEPTRGIDIGAKSEIHHLIFKLAQSGVSILLISSELPEVLRLADRIYVMRDSRIAGEMSRSQASQEAIMHMAAIGN